MKKVLAIILALICLLSSVYMIALASDEPFVEAIEDELGLDENKPKAYAIVYKRVGGIKTMYNPSPTVRFKGKGWAKITKDEPIAVNHNFVCWEDKDGNRWYAGQKMYVDTIISLYPVFSPKKDHDIQSTRVIKCALKSLIHVLEIELRLFNTATTFTLDTSETEG